MRKYSQLIWLTLLLSFSMQSHLKANEASQSSDNEWGQLEADSNQASNNSDWGDDWGDTGWGEEENDTTWSRWSPSFHTEYGVGVFTQNQGPIIESQSLNELRLFGEVSREFNSLPLIESLSLKAKGFVLEDRVLE